MYGFYKQHIRILVVKLDFAQQLTWVNAITWNSK